MTLFTPPHLLDSQRWRGMRVGLLGGTFNPPHEGHVHVSQVALRRFNLDCVWWLVTPQNPLKETSRNFAERMQLCVDMAADNPRIIVSDLEYKLGTNRSYLTLRRLKAAFPDVQFLFLGGTDNAAGFHNWYRWREIPDIMPMALIGRPPAVELARGTTLKLLKSKNIHWVLDEPQHFQSSSNIRNK